jgi:hypothetical protein
MRIRKIAKRDYYLRPVCLSVRMEQLSSYWADFHEIWYLRISRKSVEKIQVGLKSTRIPEFLHEDLFTYMISC